MSIAEPATCPDCGHQVYRPLLAPVRHPQQSCRAVAGTGRCDCPSAVHRTPSLRPRHRLDEAVVA